ncbi:hypothetical protein PC116_g7416 [Phytophthora cactorum]|uniref:Uncharacterized protein n=1 Tax=Phytophthora cactorum TaxID=29920 RepID=A0A8T1LAU3_9STRA|nr:hypothetical protein Pcac1_g13706 [Phytophthora cactorum]KAG2948502.1 hypothetical protein PC117_g5974 [Phytophthora cactorum]KAG3026092.1 hypothetical protein PC120_g6109 [Phytophthora cactorum]KAG3181553.1 hypothetical protein C6341_g6350 [Phytophthora cactorum]KAG4244756.1 hypothetical protein PC116_g7416 [Phytophthora cactorum]
MGQLDGAVATWAASELFTVDFCDLSSLTAASNLMSNILRSTRAIVVGISEAANALEFVGGTQTATTRGFRWKRSIAFN